jgi:hypothetical protein
MTTEFPKAIRAAGLEPPSEITPGVTKATESARAVGGLVVVTEFGPDRPEGETGLNDLAAHPGIEEVEQSINAATEPAADPKAVLDEIRNLPPEQQTKTRIKEAANQLDLPPSEVRRLIRGASTADQGEALTLPDIEPWSGSVEGAALLGAIAEAIDEHLHVKPAHRDMIALWTVHAHAYDNFSHSPRLGFTSPAKNCGKSTAMHVMEFLTPRPVTSDNLTPAVFFRLAAAQRPTVLIDEVDAWLRRDSDLPGAINGGFESRGGVLRCVGDRNEVRKFSTFTPVCLAGIQLDRKLPSATLSRTLMVTMERATVDELREPFNKRKHAARLERLAKQCARWAMDHAEALACTEPHLPVINRDADRWRPLVAIADLAGGEWPKRARRAIKEEMQQATEPDTGELLLRSIADIFQMNPAQYKRSISTSQLVEALSALDDDRWANYNFKDFRDTEKPIKPRQVANLLRPYDIRPHDIRIERIVQKGYRRNDIDSVLARYLPVPSATPLHSSNGAGFRGNLSATGSEAVADRKPLNTAKNGTCSVVADSRGGDGAILVEEVEL